MPADSAYIRRFSSRLNPAPAAPPSTTKSASPHCIRPRSAHPTTRSGAILISSSTTGAVVHDTSSMTADSEAPRAVANCRATTSSSPIESTPQP